MLRLRRAITTVVRPLLRVGAVAVLATGALAGPALAQDTPSTGTSGGLSPTSAPVTATPTVPGGAPLLTGPTDLGGRIGAVLGMPVSYTGTFPGAASRAVLVQRQDPVQAWATVATATTDATGAFSTTWTTDRVGLFAMRAVLAPTAGGAVQAVSSPAASLAPVTIYRPAVATYFGPGLFGRRTACGQRLTRRLQGIAHRSLPCGSIVELVFGGHVVRAPVVDRGPFRKGVRYDLTQATARLIGMRTTSTVGAALVAAAPKRSAQASR